MRSTIRPLATAAFPTASARSARMSHTSFLLARHQRFFLIGRDQSFHLLPRLLPDLAHLLIFLLRRQRSVGADCLHLRVRLALVRPALLHHRFFYAGLLPARHAAASRGLLRG